MNPWIDSVDRLFIGSSIRVQMVCQIANMIITKLVSFQQLKFVAFEDHFTAVRFRCGLCVRKYFLRVSSLSL